MAEIIKRTQRHDCHEEIKPIDVNLYLGSIVKCSCGKQYIKRDDQRDGPYWALLRGGARIETSAGESVAGK